MSSEDETPFTIAPSNEEDTVAGFDKKKLKIVLIVEVIIVVIIIIVKILNISNGPNYIEAIYSCPGLNQYCRFYGSDYYHRNLISSMTVDGKEVTVSSALKISEPGNVTTLF